MTIFWFVFVVVLMTLVVIIEHLSRIKVRELTKLHEKQIQALIKNFAQIQFDREKQHKMNVEEYDKEIFIAERQGRDIWSQLTLGGILKRRKNALIKRALATGIRGEEIQSV